MLVIHQTATFMMLTHLAYNVAIVNHVIAISVQTALYIELFEYSLSTLLTEEIAISAQLRDLIVTGTLLSHLSFIFALLMHQIPTSAF